MKKMKSIAFFFLIVLAVAACKKEKEENIAGTRNQWDGHYRMEGTMTDLVDSDFGWKDNTYEYFLHTSGTQTDSLVSKSLTFPGIVVGNTGGGITNATYYSKFGLIMSFNAGTNKVTGVTNYYGQPSSSGRSAVLDPSGANSFDPVTKNIKIKFFMDEAGVPGHRSVFDVTLVYIGTRP